MPEIQDLRDAIGMFHESNLPERHVIRFHVARDPKNSALEYKDPRHGRTLHFRPLKFSPFNSHPVRPKARNAEDAPQETNVSRTRISIKCIRSYDVTLNSLPATAYGRRSAPADIKGGIHRS